MAISFTNATHGTRLGAQPDSSLFMSSDEAAWQNFSKVDAGNGQVYLRSVHGTNLGSRGDGSVYLSTNAADWERWVIVPIDGGRVLVQSVQWGLHLGAEPSGRIYTSVNQDAWEQWQVRTLPTPVTAGQTIIISNGAHGTHLGAHPDASICMNSELQCWETWVVVSAGDGPVYLQSVHGTYLGSRQDGSAYTTTASPNAWERWVVVLLGSGQLLVQSVQWGLHLGAEPNGRIYTHINQSAWEQWRIDLASTTSMPPSQLSVGGQHGSYDWTHAWTLPAQGTGLITFTAQAQSDVHIGISPQLANADPMYEIVIGGWSNTRSVIRRASQGTEVASATTALLTPGGANPLWVSIDGQQGRIQVGRGEAGTNVILQFCDPQFIAAAQQVTFSSWDTPIAYSGIRVSSLDALPQAGQRVFLINAQYSYALGTTTAGVAQLSDHVGNQIWFVEDAGQGQVYLTDLRGNRLAAGTDGAVRLLSGNKTPDGLWRIEPCCDGTCLIRWVNNDRLLLDASADGHPLCSGGTLGSARWRLPEAIPLALVKRFAPVIVFHPNEQYFPCSIEFLLPHATLHAPNLSTPRPNPSIDDLVATSSQGSPNDETVYFEIDSSAFLGLPPDAQGHITAPLYYAVQEYPDYVHIIYAVLFASQGGQTVKGPTKNVCVINDYGRHQGDYEEIIVEIARTASGDWAIQQLACEAHGDFTWYASGLFDTDGEHPIVHSALLGHSIHNSKASDQGTWHSENTVSLSSLTIADFGSALGDGNRWRPFETSSFKLLGLDWNGAAIGDQRFAEYWGRMGKPQQQNSFVSVTYPDGSPVAGPDIALVVADQLAEAIDKWQDALYISKFKHVYDVLKYRFSSNLFSAPGSDPAETSTHIIPDNRKVGDGPHGPGNRDYIGLGSGYSTIYPLLGKETLPEASVCAPILLVSPGDPAVVGAARMYLAWTGTDQHLNIANSQNGKDNFSDHKDTLAETSNCSPALALYGNGMVLAWTGTDGRLNIIEGYGTQNRNKQTLGDTSNYAPGLASDGSHYFLAWTGSDGRLNVGRAPNGGTVILGENSNAGPTLAYLKGRLYLCWCDTDGALNISESTDGVNFGNKVRLNEQSRSAPTLTSDGSSLYLVWTGTDGRLNMLTSPSDTGSFGNKRTWNEQALQNTGAAFFGDSRVALRLYLAWAPIFGPLNVMAV